MSLAQPVSNREVMWVRAMAAAAITVTVLAGYAAFRLLIKLARS